ncbi:MAG: hypothetical protein GIKADHBN_03010 [Phycisphaerales bacterium]|nr:hypothetical protein [Phycisphaerales bacterium]
MQRLIPLDVPGSTALTAADVPKSDWTEGDL